MPWARFLAFNAGGGIAWATSYGIAYYEFGTSLKPLKTSIDIAIGAVAIVILVGFTVWLRRKQSELEQRADRELGDLDQELALPSEDRDLPLARAREDEREHPAEPVAAKHRR